MWPDPAPLVFATPTPPLSVCGENDICIKSGHRSASNSWWERACKATPALDTPTEYKPAWSVRQTSVSEEKLSRWLSKRTRSLAWSESALTWRGSEQLRFYTSSWYRVVFLYSFILYLLSSQFHPVPRGYISLFSCLMSYVQQLVINLFCHVRQGRSHRAKRKGRKELLKVQYVVSWRKFNQKRIIHWFLRSFLFHR